MKQLFYDLFGEGGKLSMMRLESLIVVITACYLAFTKPDDIGVIATLLGIGMGAKVAQKGIEVGGKDDSLQDK